MSKQSNAYPSFDIDAVLDTLEQMQSSIQSMNELNKLEKTSIEALNPASDAAQEIMRNRAPDSSRSSFDATQRPDLSDISDAIPVGESGSSKNLPRVDFVGDAAVEREFMKQLERDGKLSKDPDNGNFIIHASKEEIISRYHVAAEKVSVQENRPIVSSLVGSSEGRGDWPGGLVLGAAASHRELYQQTVRDLMTPDATPLKMRELDAAARNPSKILMSDGSYDTEAIRKLIEPVGKPSDERNAGLRAGMRQATSPELANLVVNVQFLADKLPENDEIRKGALAAVDKIEDSLNKLSESRYSLMKSIASDDLTAAQQKNLASTKDRLQSIQRGMNAERDTDNAQKSNPASLKAAGREMER